MTLLIMFFCSICSAAATALYMKRKHENNIECVKEMYSNQTRQVIEQLHVEREGHKIMIESLSEFVTVNHEVLGTVESVKLLNNIHLNSTSGIH